jgi:ADP-ribose pyrophosphatase
MDELDVVDVSPDREVFPHLKALVVTSRPVSAPAKPIIAIVEAARNDPLIVAECRGTLLADKPRKVRVENRRRVFDDFFTIDEANVSVETATGGQTPVRRLLSFERGDSVAAVVTDPVAEVVVLARQFRFPTYQKGPGWIDELVAGMLPADEAPEVAMRREIVEETGYDPPSLKPIFTFYVSPGGSSERILMYYAEIALSKRVGPGGGLSDSGEAIELVTLPFPEVWARLDAAGFRDAKTLVGLQWLRWKLTQR